MTHQATKAVLFLIGFVLASIHPAKAQETKHLVAVIGAPEEPRFSDIVSALKKGLGELGYGPPSLIIHETKIARAEEKSAKSLIDSLLKRKPQVAFLIGSRLLKPVREVSTQVPVVFITPGDPVAAGLLKSLSRPGGNSTAITFEYPELSGKRLQLLKEITPKIRRVLAVYDSSDPSPKQGIMAAREAAPSLDVSLVERDARSREEFVRALNAIERATPIFLFRAGFPVVHMMRLLASRNQNVFQPFSMPACPVVWKP